MLDLKQYIAETQSGVISQRNTHAPDTARHLLDQPEWTYRIPGREPMWDNRELNLHTSQDVLRIGPVSDWLEIPISIGHVPYVAGHSYRPDLGGFRLPKSNTIERFAGRLEKVRVLCELLAHTQTIAG